MKPTAKLIGLFATLALAAAVGCRGGDEPLPALTFGGGDGAGASGGHASGEETNGGHVSGEETNGGAGSPANAAGAATGAPCASDIECADEDACNGEERCNDEQCTNGEPVACAENLSCRPATGSCEYETPSPWLIYQGDDEYAGDDDGAYFFGLYGIPSAQIGKSAALHLTADVASEEYLTAWDPTWSPDGRYLIFSLVRHDFTSRLFWIEFGAGLPSPPRPIANLPSIGDWAIEDWSLDGRVAALADLNSGGLYLADFTSGTPIPSRAKEGTSLYFCADSRWMIYEEGEDDATGVYLFDRENDASTWLGSGTFTLSPTRERLLLQAGADSWVSECAPEAERHGVSLGYVDAFSWSNDGRYFAYASLGSQLVVEVFDAATGEPVWSGEVDQGPMEWSPSGARFLVDEVRAGEEPEVVWQILDFPGAQATVLGLPSAVSSARWVPGGVELGTEDPNTSEATAWLLRAGANEPLLLDGCSPGDAIYTPDGSLAACARQTGDLFQIRALELGPSSVVARDLLAAPVPVMPGAVGFSPDQRGVLFWYHVVAEKDYAEYWWFPAPELAGPELVVNTGDMAHTSDFQPWP